MILVHLFGVVIFNASEVTGHGHREEVLNAFLKYALVSLESQDVIAALGDDFARRWRVGSPWHQ